MIDDEGTSQQNDTGDAGLFLVRLDENSGDFAVCQRIGTAPGSRMVPGSQQTIAEFVAAQALLAGIVPTEVSDAFRDRAFLAQSGENDLGRDN